MYKNIGAGIVTYNPDLERLTENVNAILPQVSFLVLVDNGSSNFLTIQQKFQKEDQIVIVSNQENMGIAKALNQIISTAKEKGSSWVLTLDQDSICPDNLVKELSRYTKVEQVAMIAPLVIDRNRPDLQEKPNTPYVEIEGCITSGTLTNISAVERVGFFQEELFIDEVDSEMCYRLRMHGYKILSVSSVVLLHELGNLTPYYLFPKLGEVFHIDFFQRPKYSTNHSNIRKYYITRNNIYVLRKYKHSKAFDWKLKRKRFLKMVLLWSVLEPFSIKKWKATIQGFVDGFRMKIT